VADDGAGDGAAVVNEADRNAPAVAVAGEVGGAVDRVQHPERAGAIDGAPLLFPENFLPGKVFLELLAQEAFGGAVGFGEEVLGALHGEICHAGFPHGEGTGGGFAGQGGGDVAAAGEFVAVHQS